MSLSMIPEVHNFEPNGALTLADVQKQTDNAQAAALQAGHQSEFYNPTVAERRINEVVAAQVAEFLATQGLSSKDVLLLLHKYSAQGVRLWDDVTEKEVPGGQLRTHEVSVGDIIPPHHSDVAKLVDTFSTKFDMLLTQAGAGNVELLALWGYIVLMTIHPFDDVNGRVGRGFIDYTIQSVMKARGITVPVHRLDYTHEQLNETAYSEIDTPRYDLGLVPAVVERDSSQNKVVVTTTAMEMYHQALVSGKPEIYFETVAQLLKNHIDSVRSIEDLAQMKSLAEFRRLLDLARNAKKYSTVNLAAEEAREAIKTSLSR